MDCLFGLGLVADHHLCDDGHGHGHGDGDGEFLLVFTLQQYHIASETCVSH